MLIEVLENTNVNRDVLLRMGKVDFINKDIINEVRNFHKSLPMYKRTPLIELNEKSRELGLGNIFIKDESYRFGLNAFKVLGGAYAIIKYLAEKLNMNVSELSFEYLSSSDVKEKLGELTFVTATDGNHGRGVAWAANKLGQKSVVFMPKGSSEIRLENIKAEGAKAEITQENYEGAVKIALEYSKENNASFVQDVAFEGYEKIPTWITQGYTTIMDEVAEELEENKGRDFIPSHIFLQVGVGAFAGAMIGYLIWRYKEKCPKIIIVEPKEAACIFKSIEKNDGKPHVVEGEMKTIMAGLACGEPSSNTYGLIRDYAYIYMRCDDEVSKRGMRILAKPKGNDEKVISGESGAVGMGALDLILKDGDYIKLKEKLELNNESKVLIVSTEGNTDPVTYNEIISELK